MGGEFDGETEEPKTMQYMLIIFDDPSEMAKLNAAEKQQIFADYGAFTQSIIKSGNFKSGDPLQPITTATTIRIRGSKKMVTDGPFAESKEHLVGYYLIEAKDLDEALACAGRVPGARMGSVEVRPVLEMPAAKPQTAPAGR